MNWRPDSLTNDPAYNQHRMHQAIDDYHARMEQRAWEQTLRDIRRLPEPKDQR